MKRHRAALVFAASIVAGCAEPGAAPETTSPRTTEYVVGSRPRSVAVADLNRDGRLDVVVANSGDGTLTPLFGGARGLTASPAIPAGTEPADVEALDLDRDGDVDLVVANHETSKLTVLMNDGAGAFRPAVASPLETGSKPHVHGLASGDFDGDGWNDVAVESADTHAVRVLRGGPGGLAPPLAIPIPTMPYYRLGAADVTGDGHPDILVPGHGDRTVRVITLQRGRLAPWSRVIHLADQPWMVVGDDVNGDRRNDVIVVHTRSVSVWLARPDGFGRARGSPFPLIGATEVATGDVDGDGKADIAIGPWEDDAVTLLMGKDLVPRRVRVCERPIGLAIADLDGDGRGELIAACATSNRLVVVSVPR